MLAAHVEKLMAISFDLGNHIGFTFGTVIDPLTTLPKAVRNGSVYDLVCWYKDISYGAQGKNKKKHTRSWLGVPATLVIIY